MKPDPPGQIDQWRDREPITTAEWDTGAAAMVGVVLLVTDRAMAQLASGHSLFGMALVICSAIALETAWPRVFRQPAVSAG